MYRKKMGFSWSHFSRRKSGKLDAVFPEKRHAFSGDQRVRITGTDVYPANAAFHQCLSAWRLLAVVAAWLQGDVDICTGRVFDAVLQGVSFCVEIAVSGVPALTDDAVVFDDHRTHQKLGLVNPVPRRAS